MYIKTLKLKNYRNYEEIEVNFDPNINIIYGNNAEGKTNLLESIYMCSTSKSHRNTKENDIINFNKSESHIKLIFNRGNDVGANTASLKNEIIDIQLNKDSKKGVAKNGIKVEKLSEFLGFFNVIMFAPEDLNIIKDGPAVSRRFLDIELSQTDKIYVNIIQNYNKTLNQRNALLKDIYKTIGNNRHDLIEMLETYDEQLFNYGLEVIKKRSENIKIIAKKIYDIHLLISENKEKLIVSYENDILPVGASTASPKEIYLKKLRETRDIDIKNQYTMIGPHRDDISFKVEDKDIRKFGSQGQKKTAAISLKLSELSMLKEKINDTPVLLLDDVFSELDEGRQKCLTRNFKDNQVIEKIAVDKASDYSKTFKDLTIKYKTNVIHNYNDLTTSQLNYLDSVDDDNINKDEVSNLLFKKQFELFE